MAEPPFDIIWRHLSKGELIPFVGAGASLGSRATQKVGVEAGELRLPSGRELAHMLAEESEFPEGNAADFDDLAKVASYYVEASDRTSLVSRLQEVFVREYEVGALHEFLADLPAPALIVTTNYDDLIEAAFQRRSKPYHLVVHPTEQKDNAASVLWWEPGADTPKAYPPATLPLSLRDTTIIYKIHGSVDRQMKKWDSFVITEEDYVDFLSRMTGQAAIPARFLLEFRRRRFLFLGYGLRDWNLRVMLKTLKSALAATPATAQLTDSPGPGQDLRSWAVQYKPSELEQILWRARKVNIYDMDINAFVARMRERMD